MKVIKNLNLLLVLALLATAAVSCLKKDFDEPPFNQIVPDAKANTTIAALKKLHVTAGGFDEVKTDLVIAGEVIMDDRSGNYYKTLVIQDATGGIEVKFNDGYLYTKFPVGRTIFIKCKGLILTDYNDLPQLAGGLVEENGSKSSVGLTEAQVASVVVQGGFATTPIAAKSVKISDLNESMVSTLIRLEDVQFTKADTAKTYADPVSKNSLNRKVEDCSAKSILLRSSGYATFVADKTATGKGSLTCVLGIYKGEYQIFIRDLNDVQMTGTRCGGSNGGGGGGGTVASLDEKFDGNTDNQDVAISGWYNIGVVGNRTWIGKSFSGNKFAQNSAYNSNLAAMESWLITPALDLKTQKTLSFESAMGFYTHAGLEVFISNNFTGDPKTATWTKINCTLAGSGQANYDWVKSGDIALPIYSSGTGHIGFKYTGNTTSQTTTYRVDNVLVK